MATWEEIRDNVAGMLADKTPMEDIIGSLEEYKKLGGQTGYYPTEFDKCTIQFGKPFEQAIIKVIRKQRKNRRLWGRN